MLVKTLLNRCHPLKSFVYGAMLLDGNELIVEVKPRKGSRFWSYTGAHWAGWFLDRWCARAMRSRLEPIKKFVLTRRAHRHLLLNWLRAKKAISSAIVEGMNANAKLAVRRARGFRTYEATETALYHVLGALPEPEWTHAFC